MEIFNFWKDLSVCRLDCFYKIVITIFRKKCSSFLTTSFRIPCESKASSSKAKFLKGKFPRAFELMLRMRKHLMFLA